MAAPAEGAEDAKLFVGGLPRDCSQEALTAWASQFGSVVKADVKTDTMGTPRGFAFLTFADGASAQRVVANGPNNILEGKKIDCKLATPPGGDGAAGGSGKGTGKGDPNNPKLFVGALPKTCTQEGVTAFFSQYGAVKEVLLKYAEDGQCKGFAFVTFEDPASARKVLDNYDNNMFEGKWIDCKAITQQPKGDKGGGKDKGGCCGGFGGFGGGYGGGYGCMGGYGGGYGCGKGGYGAGCGGYGCYGAYGGGCGGCAYGAYGGNPYAGSCGGCPCYGGGGYGGGAYTGGAYGGGGGPCAGANGAYGAAPPPPGCGGGYAGKGGCGAGPY